MKRLGINFNPFIEFIKRMKINSYNINHLVSLADLNHIDAISLYYDTDLANINYEELAIIKHLSHSFLNVKVNASNDSYRKILDLKPDMITICGDLNPITYEAEAVSLDQDIEKLKHVVDMIKSNQIFCSIAIHTDMKELRQISKTAIDYVDIDFKALAESSNIKEENEILDNINLISAASEKLGIGLNARNFSINDNLLHLEDLNLIEEIYTDIHFFEDCLIRGFQNNLQSYVDKIKRL
jgi:pyridoxine 5'-phosphate synthase PdxJ